MTGGSRFAYVPTIIPGEGFRLVKAYENQPETSVASEFAPPGTWALAAQRADQLNEQLGLRPEDVQQIVSSAAAAAKTAKAGRLSQPAPTPVKQAPVTFLPLMQQYRPGRRSQ